jgi:transcriptional regulator with XRE-family HTH domain
MQEFSHKDFTEKLKTARKEKFKTQEQISAALGIKRVTYARYETGVLPPFSVFYKICKILDVSADYFLEPFKTEDSDENQ